MSRQPIDDNNKGFQALFIGATQKVSYTGTAAQSAAFAAATKIVQLYSTTDCWILFGSNPTAVASAGTSAFLPGGMIIAYGCIAGQKVSAIRDVTSGDLHIIEGA